MHIELHALRRGLRGSKVQALIQDEKMAILFSFSLSHSLSHLAKASQHKSLYEYNNYLAATELINAPH